MNKNNFWKKMFFSPFASGLIDRCVVMFKQLRLWTFSDSFSICETFQNGNASQHCSNMGCDFSENLTSIIFGPFCQIFTSQSSKVMFTTCEHSRSLKIYTTLGYIYNITKSGVYLQIQDVSPRGFSRDHEIDSRNYFRYAKRSKCA